MWLYYAIAAIVFFATFAMMVREGLWSNTIALICIILSGLAAFGFYQPLTVWVDEMTDGSYTYLLDIVMLWAVYVVAMVVLSGLAAVISKTRMRFKNPIDPVGGPVVALGTAWVLMSFTLATLHTAPLAKDTMGGGLVHSSSEVGSKSALTSPDLWWLRFAERAMSNDVFGSGEPFKASAFVTIYAAHRDGFANTEDYLVKRN
jgi:uncharacterized membrane protein required for colicin V production